MLDDSSWSPDFAAYLSQIRGTPLPDSLALDVLQLLDILTSPQSMSFSPHSPVTTLITTHRLTPNTHSYRVRISNDGSSGSVRVLGRSWLIKSTERRERQEIHQPTGGVVGRYPVIPPGHCFEYVSGCDVGPEGGMMEVR